MTEIQNRYDYGDYNSLDAFMNAVLRDSRTNAEETVYLLAEAMARINEMVARYNEASDFWSSFHSNYDTDGDGECSQDEYDAYIKENGEGSIPWPSGYDDDDPPTWLGYSLPTTDQAEDYASSLSTKSSTWSTDGSMLLTELQAANNDLDEADRIHTAWIEQRHQTNLVIMNNLS